MVTMGTAPIKVLHYYYHSLILLLLIFVCCSFVDVHVSLCNCCFFLQLCVVCFVFCFWYCLLIPVLACVLFDQTGRSTCTAKTTRPRYTGQGKPTKSARTNPCIQPGDIHLYRQEKPTCTATTNPQCHSIRVHLIYLCVCHCQCV